MTTSKIRPIDPSSAGKVGCCIMGCRQLATLVEEYRNNLMPTPAFYCYCARHESEVHRITIAADSIADWHATHA